MAQRLSSHRSDCPLCGCVDSVVLIEDEISGDVLFACDACSVEFEPETGLPLPGSRPVDTVRTTGGYL